MWLPDGGIAKSLVQPVGCIRDAVSTDFVHHDLAGGGNLHVRDLRLAGKEAVVVVALLKAVCGDYVFSLLVCKLWNNATIPYARQFLQFWEIARDPGVFGQSQCVE